MIFFGKITRCRWAALNFNLWRINSYTYSILFQERGMEIAPLLSSCHCGIKALDLSSEPCYFPASRDYLRKRSTTFYVSGDDVERKPEIK